MDTRKQVVAMTGPDVDGRREQSPPGASVDAERQRRIDVLRALAEQAAPIPHPAAPVRAAPRPSSTPPSRRNRNRNQQSRNRWLAGIAATLCVVVIAVVALTRLAHAPAPISTHPSGPTVIRPALDHIGCPQNAIWSPDGTQFAVFGDNCGASDTMLNVYDATSGKLTAQADVTADTNRALVSYTPGTVTRLIVGFHAALWTKDSLFVPFEVFDPSTADPASAVPAEGLLGYNPDGAAPLQPGVGIVPNRSGPYAYVGWDSNGFTSSYTAMYPDALVGPAPNHTVFSSLPPSLDYDLGLFSPHPQTPLSYRTRPPNDPGGRIGDPTSALHLTIWQPGTLTYFATVPGTATPASIVLFDTSFTVLAPPILYTNLTFEGRLVPPDQPAPDVSALAAAGMLAPWLPVRDSALADVLADVEHSAAPGVGPAAVAWRPDGAALAYQPGIAIGGGGDSGPRAHDVRIYDCHTGQVLATLTPPLPAGTPIRAINLLRWSPDGSRLLLLDRVATTIVVWGQGPLPA